MSDCRKGGRLAYLPPEDEREPGVLYQHPLYSLKFYEQLTAIEVRGVRFERVRYCKNASDGVCGDFECSECGDAFEDGIRGVDDVAFCPFCGARVKESES